MPVMQAVLAVAHYHYSAFEAARSYKALVIRGVSPPKTMPRTLLASAM